MRASKRRKDVSVDTDGYIVGVNGVTRTLLRVPGLALDALSTSDQERHAALFGALVASLPRKARLSVFIENRPADAGALVAGLRAQFAPEPYTPQLGELGDRLLAWWARRLSGTGTRHVADIAYWLLVDPYPPQEGYPDQSPTERLGQAVRAVTRQLVAMGLPPVVASHADAQAFLGRHTWRKGREDVNAYYATDPTTGRGRWYRTLFLVAPPAYTEPGWARALVAADCPATVVVHVRGLSRAWERRRQGWRLRMMEGTRAGGTDVATSIAATDAIDQATALHTQGYGIVKVGCYVRLEGATRAQLDARVGRVLLGPKVAKAEISAFATLGPATRPGGPARSVPGGPPGHRPPPPVVRRGVWSTLRPAWGARCPHRPGGRATALPTRRGDCARYATRASTVTPGTRYPSSSRTPRAWSNARPVACNGCPSGSCGSIDNAKTPHAHRMWSTSA